MASLPTDISGRIAHIAEYSSTEYTEVRSLVTYVGLEHIAGVSSLCSLLFQVSIVCQTACVVAMLQSKKFAFPCLVRTGVWHLHNYYHCHFTVWPFNPLVSNKMVTRYAQQHLLEYVWYITGA